MDYHTQDDFIVHDDGNQDVNELNRQLFGEDEEDLQDNGLQFLEDRDNEQLEDDIDQPEGQAEPVAAGHPGGTGDVRAKLEALVRSKKQREAGGEGKSKTKKKKEKSEKAEKPSKKRKAEDSGARRSKRMAHDAHAERGDEPRQPAGDDDVNSEEVHEEDGDRAFIDDEGAEPVESDNEDERIAHAEEAEEVDDDEDDVDRMLKARKRKKGGDVVNVEHEVRDMLSKMEAAAEHDYETVAQNSGIQLKRDAAGNLVTDADGHPLVERKAAPPKSKTPAITKLKMLSEVELFLAQRKFHESFINQGGLGTLKGWLEPYADHSLPNVRVRSTVLKCLQLLPVDTGQEDHKEILRKSQLGRNIMFLYKCPDETKENKDLAKALVHKWSRPLFYDQEAEEAKKHHQQQSLMEARRLALERQKVDGHADLSSRGKATRIHALIPQASKLDYVNNPGAAADYSAPLDAGGPKPAKQVDFITKRIRDVQRKAKEVGGRAMKPSVEGRNIVLTS